MFSRSRVSVIARECVRLPLPATRGQTCKLTCNTSVRARARVLVCVCAPRGSPSPSPARRYIEQSHLELETPQIESLGFGPPRNYGPSVFVYPLPPSVRGRRGDEGGRRRKRKGARLIDDVGP